MGQHRRVKMSVFSLVLMLCLAAPLVFATLRSRRLLAPGCSAGDLRAADRHDAHGHASDSSREL